METIMARQKEASTGERPSHIVAGDLNFMVRLSSYAEWLHEEGLMELTDPDRPTFATGSTLDKFILQPGSYVPPSLLPSPPSTMHEGIHEEDTLQYPGTVVDCSHISDHIPIVLPLTYRLPEKPKHEEWKLKIKHLTEEDWSQKSILLQTCLGDKGTSTPPNRQKPNPGGRYQALLGALQEVFKSEFRVVQQKREQDPLE